MKRYTPIGLRFDMQESECGSYVLYDDYREFEKEACHSFDKLCKERDELVSKISKLTSEINLIRGR